MFGLIPDDLREYPFILAVSGGPDSMAMAAHALGWQSAMPELKMRAVIIDHGIRAESGHEADLVQRRLREMGIAATVRKVRESPPQKGMQAWARAMRYQLLADEARRDDAVVVTAHHADDQAETVAMRLEAGSGLLGLKGMSAVSRQGDMKILRPFLTYPRTILHQILEEDGIPFVEDPSNDDAAFDRIAWRQRLSMMADDNRMRDSLLRLRDTAGSLTDIVSTALITAMDGGWGVAACGALWMDKAQLMALPDEASVMVARQVAMRRGQARYPISYDAARRAVSSLKKKDKDGIAATLGGLEWMCRGDTVWVYPEAERDCDEVAHDGEAGFFDGIWKVESPIAGRLQAMGARRAAALREAAPEMFSHLMDSTAGRAPMRALWRLPVLMPASEMPAAKKPDHLADLFDQDGLIALEDGAIIPHVVKNGLNFRKLRHPLKICDCRAEQLL